ncbi:MAG: DMT family transporter [Acidiferrobacterales bacterium]|jgi:drug/metabolite transporter (DMT)-like permease|nr:DMT family transporter [Acidiferrobacterales bacterium]
MTIKPVSDLVRTGVLTGLALIAFAANTVLCRMALADNNIDAASFTAVRLFSGAAILLLIIRLNPEKASSPTRGSWIAGSMLFLYAITFSYAYITLDTATGALILFASVQITIILLSLFSGNRLHLSEWLGLVVAFGGFVYLVLPGVTSPSLLGFVLMTVAGIGWGVYTLKGRGSRFPLTDTAYNFVRTLPLALVPVVLTGANLHFSAEGIVLAVLSGALASGVGYSIWYAALRGLSTTQSAVVQLSVPIIAAFGGVIFVSEMITLRLSISATLILGGILLVILGRYYYVQRNRPPSEV